MSGDGLAGVTASDKIGGSINSSADSDGMVLPSAMGSALAPVGIRLASDNVGVVVANSGIDEIDAAAGSTGEDVASLPTGK